MFRVTEKRRQDDPGGVRGKAMIGVIDQASDPFRLADYSGREQHTRGLAVEFLRGLSPRAEAPTVVRCGFSILALELVNKKLTIGAFSYLQKAFLVFPPEQSAGFFESHAFGL
jgi:hypothetical protein